MTAGGRAKRPTPPSLALLRRCARPRRLFPLQEPVRRCLITYSPARALLSECCPVRRTKRGSLLGLPLRGQGLRERPREVVRDDVVQLRRLGARQEEGGKANTKSERCTQSTPDVAEGEDSRPWGAFIAARLRVRVLEVLLPALALLDVAEAKSDGLRETQVQREFRNNSLTPQLL